MAEQIDQQVEPEQEFRVTQVDQTGEMFVPAGAEESFPEDYEDYYPRGLLDNSDLKLIDEQNGISIESKREDVRGRLAMIYTVATFFMFLLGFIAAILDSALRQTSIIENLSVILPLLSGLFLGSLGFVLGYYFRKIDSEE